MPAARTDDRVRRWQGRGRGRTLGPLLASALAVSSAVAAADPLTDNHYSLDVFQGPVLAPIRVTGIAGAYAGYAEGIEGMVANAAAPAVREPFSVSSTSIDISGSISLPLPVFEANDFDNSGTLDYRYKNFVYATLGGLIQVGAIGVGGIGEAQRYTLSDPRGYISTEVTLGKYHVLAAWQLLGEQLMIGMGFRIATLGLDAAETNFTLAGAATEMGVLIRPDFEPLRLGATFRFPVTAELVGGGTEVDEDGVRRAGGLVLPDHVVLPWELEVGLAIQVGPRPLNPKWLDPAEHEAGTRWASEQRKVERRRAHQAALLAIKDPEARARQAEMLAARDDEADVEEDKDLGVALAALKRERRARYWRWPREHFLITAEILVTGPAGKGVSLERFLGQNLAENVGQPSAVGTSGRLVSFSPRFGIETEPILNRVQTRLGSYYEPSRFGAPVGRQHFTFGADLKLLPTTWGGLSPEVIYKLQASMDLAPRYESASFGIGVWH